MQITPCQNIITHYCQPPPVPQGRGQPLYLLMKAELVEQAALVVKDPPILINMVSKRVKQLTSGRAPLVDRRPGLREADLALLEIIHGKIKAEDLADA